MTDVFHELRLVLTEQGNDVQACIDAVGGDVADGLCAYAQMLAAAAEQVYLLAEAAREHDIGVMGIDFAVTVDVEDDEQAAALVAAGVLVEVPLSELDAEDDEDDEDDEDEGGGEDVAWICPECGEINPIKSRKCKGCGAAE